MPVVQLQKFPPHVGRSAHDLENENHHPGVLPLFRNCRWGLNAVGKLTFDNIPDQPNSSTEAGWHIPAAKRLAEVLSMTVEFGDDEIVFTPLPALEAQHQSRLDSLAARLSEVPAASK